MRSIPPCDRGAGAKVGCGKPHHKQDLPPGGRGSRPCLCIKERGAEGGPEDVVNAAVICGCEERVMLYD